jgi:predicted transcriptional regulator of viral defense system
MYLAFEKTFRDYPIFSIRDIKKSFPDFDNRRLVEWQQKGYIMKVRRGFYCFKEREKDENFLYYAANRIYSPSYVSFESAMNYYGIIPEGTFTITSASTRNTASFETPIGNYTYRHFKPVLYFGYKLIQSKGISIRMAEPEKVILDYFYLSRINSLEEIEGMRFNEIQTKEIIDLQKLEKYQNIFNSSILNRRIQLLKKVINA